MSENENENTQIQIKKSTAGKLKKLWKHADNTYDAIINRLLEGIENEL